MNYRGLILKESMTNGKIPESIAGSVETEYQYRLDGVIPVTVIRLQIPATDLLPAAWEVALALLPEHYFANFIGSDDMVVAFPNALVRILRNAPATAELARSVGRHFGIPDHQMRFDAMFAEDHPHTPEDQSSASAGE